MPQSLANILVHLVFSTKDRRPFIHPAVEGELHAYLVKMCRICGCPSHRVGGAQDHVHILCSLSRTITVADLVEEVKKRSSKWIKTKGPQYRTFSWQSGYGAFSIGQSGVDALKRYIARQKDHHKRITFQDEYRALLAKYQIEYEERYLWD